MITRSDIEINKAIAICTAAGIQVTTVKRGAKYAVRVIIEGQETIYRAVYKDRISSAIKKTYRHYAYLELKKQQNETT